MSPDVRQIVLTGPPGVGKSTVAPRLAGRLGGRSQDLDLAVRQRHGRSPAEIIDAEGEARFRELERETLECLGAEAVLAVGGGALTQGATRSLLRRRGVLVGLEAPSELLWARLQGGEPRPLSSSREALEALLARRARTQLAVDLRVDATAAPDAVVDEILRSTADTHLIHAEVGAQRSRILVGRGLEAAAAGALAALAPSRTTLVVLDVGVPEAARTRYLEALRAVAPCVAFEVEGGETVKTWSRLGQLLEAALAAGGGRQGAVVGLGGGATCDLAALCAALLGRGAPLVLVPSTVLAQADASVGGKCAVNLGGRNLVGAFHAARDVIVDVALTASLPEAERRAGLAEVLKIGLISDPALFEAVVAEPRATATQLARAIRLKADIVARDPHEGGERKKLNLGHTLGHALETASGFELRHGDAVAIGMAAIARWSAAHGHCSAETCARVVDGLRQVGLPTEAPDALCRAAEAHLQSDKKADHDGLDLIVIRDVGDVAVRRVEWQDIAPSLVRHGGRS